MKIQVLMAAREGIVRGKKIDFELDTKSNLYIASCEGNAFGVASKLLFGKKHHLKQLGTTFSGVAVKIDPETRNMEVKVRPDRRIRRRKGGV